MKNKVLIFLSIIALTIVASCTKLPDIYLNSEILSDKDKIDIKGSLMNGDMRNPNIEAYYVGKTLYVYFHDYLGVCTVTLTNSYGIVMFSEITPAYLNAEWRHYMGDMPFGRYHLTISDGIGEAEGWFNNFRIVAHQTQ